MLLTRKVHLVHVVTMNNLDLIHIFEMFSDHTKFMAIGVIT